MTADPWGWVEGPAATPAPKAQRTRSEPTDANHPMAWADQAACTHLDPNLFYPNRGQAIDAKVVAACDRCPVRPACLGWALRREHHGYWAGTSERGRRRMRRALGIQIEEDQTPHEDLAS